MSGMFETYGKIGSALTGNALANAAEQTRILAIQKADREEKAQIANEQDTIRSMEGRKATILTRPRQAAMGV